MAPAQSICGRRILVVEDEVFIAEDLKRILEENGAVVLGPSMTVAGAMKLATSELLDAAILDVGLRGEDVTAVAAVLASRAIPFVFWRF